LEKKKTVEKRLEEIQKELKRIRVGSDLRWVFSIGLVAVIFASTLIPMEPNRELAVIVFAVGISTMILVPYIRLWQSHRKAR